MERTTSAPAAGITPSDENIGIELFSASMYSASSSPRTDVGVLAAISSGVCACIQASVRVMTRASRRVVSRFARIQTPMNSFLDVKTLLFVGLGIMLVAYAAAVLHPSPTPLQAAIGFVTAFFDTLGIGLYAHDPGQPARDPTAAVPIMMSSCAFLMPTSSVRFANTQTYHVQAALGLALGGVPAVLIAAYLVKSLPLTAVRWLVVCVVVYTSLNMLLTARAKIAGLPDGSMAESETGR